MKIKKMKFLSVIAFAILTFTFLLTSCKSDEPTVDGFYYSVDGSSTKMKADSAFYNTSENVIEVYGGKSLVAALYLSKIAVGTYTINESNNLYYWSTGINFNSTAGSIIISAVANNKISGTFNITAGTNRTESGGIKTITGEFVNVPLTTNSYFD